MLNLTATNATDMSHTMIVEQSTPMGCLESFVASGITSCLSTTAVSGILSTRKIPTQATEFVISTILMGPFET